jgi:hypothetical protein
MTDPKLLEEQLQRYENEKKQQMSLNPKKDELRIAMRSLTGRRLPIDVFCSIPLGKTFNVFGFKA